MEYRSIAGLVEQAEERKCRIGELVLREQASELEIPEIEVYERMEKNLRVMEESVREGMNPDLRSTSGLTGGDAFKMQRYAVQEKSLMGRFVAEAIARGTAVAEYNAAMGKIVAAPTAGSCGIMPGCLVSMLAEQRAAWEEVVYAMFTAAGFGMVIANRASISGAQGGCQAECGSAAAMTAAALVELQGGSPQQAAHACAIALKNQLGLVCDPVAGLVEIPCIKRNAGGIAIAFSSADMALAGICSHIPADEVIDAMKEIGDGMPCSLKETAKGGLAATPSGKKLREKVFGK